MRVELYILAFGALRSTFTTHELNELGDTMMERGIRMRRSLDEAVEGFVDGTEPLRRKEVVDWGEEDIEHNAEELRRLRPY